MSVQNPQQEEKVRSLRVRVVDNAKEGHPVVNIRIPLRVAKFGVKMARTFSPEMKNVDVDWDAVTAMIDAGDLGKIVEVEDEAEHKTVEVWVE